MIPYAGFLYFGVLLYVIVPTLLLGLTGRLSWRWILLATVAMLLVQYGGVLQIDPRTAVREIWIVAAYALFEWAVARSFLRLRAGARHRRVFHGALALALLPLLIAKFLPLLAPSTQFGFLGISYVTFRALDVIFCVQDQLITALPPLQFLAYLFFFATISSGPIDRYRRFDSDWKHRRNREELIQDLDGAAQRIFTGFLYKFILAALVKQYWMDPVSSQPGFLGTLSYMYAYSFYLFFDFAGYSAFAIGVSYLFGIHTPENFDRPFLARNIRDFWNRWHITLSWWFRDHVYMRFVMAATKGRWFKSRHTGSYLGFVLTFGLMGVWHGTAVHYLLYGLYHGALLVGHDIFNRWNKARKWWADGPLSEMASVAITFNCVCFSFLIFSGHLTSSDSATVALGPHTYEGSADHVDCTQVRGWVRDQSGSGVPVAVDIYADGMLLGHSAADQIRFDSGGNEKGDGRRGFAYDVPARLKDGEPHVIDVKVAATNIRLGNSPQWAVCITNAVRTMDGHDGAHDVADCNQIGGWAWDAVQPDTPIAVDIFDAQTKVATVTADQFRKDLRDAGYGSGHHAFALPTPPAFKDGRPHVVLVRIAGTNVDLTRTPKVLCCPAG